MNISNDNPSVDPIEYITKQLPKDLVQLLQVRDELAVRQGALSAVEDAVADRAKAKAEMEAARAAEAAPKVQKAKPAPVDEDEDEDDVVPVKKPAKAAALAMPEGLDDVLADFGDD